MARHSGIPTVRMTTHQVEHPPAITRQLEIHLDRMPPTPFPPHVNIALALPDGNRNRNHPSFVGQGQGPGESGTMTPDDRRVGVDSEAGDGSCDSGCAR